MLLNRVLLLSSVFLSGCVHPVVLFKATQVSHNGQAFVECAIHISDKASPELKQHANQLCAMSQKEFANMAVVPTKP